MTTAMTLAEEVAANAPVAVQLTKRLAYQSLTRSPDEALSLAASAQGVAQNTSDHLEGVEVAEDISLRSIVWDCIWREVQLHVLFIVIVLSNRLMN